MKLYRLLVIIIITLLFVGKSYPQQSEADSLIHVLKLASGDEKVNILNNLADIYQFIDTHEAISYAQKGIELAKSIGYDKGLAGCYGSLGYAYINLDNQKAAEYTNEALNIRRRIKDEAGIATSLNVLGVLYYYEGDYLKSIEYHLEALKRREKIGNPLKTATSYNNIAIVNIALENYDAALNYLYKGLEIREATNNQRAIGIIKVNIGEIQALTGKTNEALESFFVALTINKKLGNYKSLANTFQNIASVYKTLNEFSISLNYYDSASALYSKLEEKNGFANVENGVAQVYKSIEKYEYAISHAEKALEHSNKINSLENKVIALETLYSCYFIKKDYKKAYEYLSQHKIALDELKNNDKIKKLAKVELEYQLEKIKTEKEEELNNQKIFIILLVLIVLFGLVILTLLIRNAKNKKIVNDELNQLNLQLSEVNKTKDKFLSIIAHDLRGPYQTTLGLSQFISDDFEALGKDDLKGSIKNLNSSLKNQYNLLNDLLHWAELQGGSFTLETEKIKLIESVSNVNSLLQLAAQKKNIKLFNNVNDDIFVSADKNMLHLVLRNLISNSIKFTTKDGYVKVTSEIKNGDIHICVEDTGIGIPKDEYNKLFKLDSHYSKKGTSNEEGSGLGLILCKEIVEKHGGKIWVESEINKGTKFFFTLSINK